MKAIIFGSNGQDGYYMRKLLEKKGINVFSISRTTGDCLGDVSDLRFVQEKIRLIQPNYIFSFAANSTTSHEALFENHYSISTGTINILESARIYTPKCKVFISGSAMQFKNIGLPIDENTPFEASSPYSFSRIHSVYAARYYREKYCLKVYVGYFFNHDSPLRSDRHINQKIVSTARRIANGSKELLEIGNMNIQKEFAFAGDIIEGIWTLINQNITYEAIIGCGEAHPLKEWIEICFSKFGLNWIDYVIPKKEFKAEYEILVSNPILINNMGWKCKIDIESLAEMMIHKKCYI